jgi:hypothetical protein
LKKKRCLKINVAGKEKKAKKIGIIEKYDVVEKYKIKKNENFNYKKYNILEKTLCLIE